MVKTENEWADEVNCLKSKNHELKSLLEREQMRKGGVKSDERIHRQNPDGNCPGT
jgi:hypothetical protein